MFTSSSAVTASIWGLHGTIGDPNTAGTSAPGGFTPLTLAPNGYLYGAPRAAGINSIMVVDPGNANSPSTNYTVPTVTFVQAGTSGDRPAMPSTTGIDQAPALYNSKGVLAPNGYIYYAPHTAGVTVGSTTRTGHILVIDPGSGPTDCRWYIISAPNFTQAQVAPNNAPSLGGFYSGCVLGSDSKLYFIPQSTPTLFRFALPAWGTQPSFEYSFYSNVSWNSGNSLTIRQGVSSASRIGFPRDKDGTILAGTTWSGTQLTTGSYGCVNGDPTTFPYSGPQLDAQNTAGTTGGLFSRGYGGFHAGGLTSNGKIILTPKLRNFGQIIDINEWANANAVYTTSQLSTSAIGASACATALLKMGPAINSSNELVYVTTPSKYGLTMFGIGGIDVKANLYKPFILTELGYSTINITNTKYPLGIRFGPPAGTYTPSVNTSELSVATLLPNKKLIMASATLQNISTVNSTSSQYILDITKNNPTFYRVGDVTIQSPPPQYPATYIGPNFFKRWEYPGAQSLNTVTGGFTVLTGNKVGKIIVSLIQGLSTTPIRGCYEIMSVKGFYQGVSEFDLIPTLKDPIDLATLATSNYNLYFNQPVKSLGNG